MNIKRLMKQALGILGMVIGSCLAFLVLRALIVGHITSVWMVINDFLISSVAMYLFYRGVLAVRGINYSQRAGPRFGWGRVLIGSALVFSNAYNYRHSTPTPEFLHPTNETQAVAMKTTETALLCGAVGLIIWGIAVGVRSWKDPQDSSTSVRTQI